MAAAFELGGEEQCQDLLGQAGADHSAADTEHVGVVVLARHAGGVQVVAQRSAHAAHLVGGQLLALAAAADDDAVQRLAVAHRAPDRGADLRVVDGLGAVRAQVEHVVPTCLQHTDEVLLEFVAGVVGANRDP